MDATAIAEAVIRLFPLERSRTGYGCSFTLKGRIPSG